MILFTRPMTPFERNTLNNHKATTVSIKRRNTEAAAVSLVLLILIVLIFAVVLRFVSAMQRTRSGSGFPKYKCSNIDKTSNDV